MQHVRPAIPFRAVIVWALICSCAMAMRTVGAASPNDTARLLAGLPPAVTSPLAALATSPDWQRYAGEMTTAWAAFEKRHSNRVRVWAAAKLPAPRATMFYMFGGPDFIHADAFFPSASTYVLSGLEPIGREPDVSAVSPEALATALSGLRRSLGNFLQYGYFVTSEMDRQFRSGELSGVLPVLYVFLARSDKTIRAVKFVSLNGRGEAAPVRGRRRPGGVRISFSGSDGVARTLYYFRTDLSNAGVGKSGFLKFCARLAPGDALLKSASYLMHTSGFSKVREFLLGHSRVIVQDDSGIPLKYFAPGEWRLRPFGRYAGPTEEFKRHYQPDLESLFRAGAQPVNFGIGYRWHPQRTNILIADQVIGPGGGGQ